MTLNTIDNIVARLSQYETSIEMHVSDNIVEHSRVVKQLWDKEKDLITKQYTKLTTIKNTYEIFDGLRKDTSTLLDCENMEVSDELILVNDVLVRNNSYTINSLVTVATT